MNIEPQIVTYRLDQHGSQTTADREVRMLVPENVLTEGLANVSGYMERLFNSETHSALVVISTLNKQKGFGVIRRGEQAALSFLENGQSVSPQEMLIRSVFTQQGIAPTTDRLSFSGNVRVLQYPAGDNSEQVTTTCLLLLRSVYSITEEEGLTFYFNGHAHGPNA